MSVEENLRMIQAEQKALNDRDLDPFKTLHLNSVVQRDPQNPQGIKGPKAIRASLTPFLKAFPDIRLVTETQFGAGDWVTQLGHMRGTNTGPLEIPGAPTIPATNKSVRMPVAMIAKLEGGKFAEINLYFDQAGLMTQLGLTPQGPPRGNRDLHARLPAGTFPFSPLMVSNPAARPPTPGFVPRSHA